jgi:FAD/FMN-containing dehydrogenase/Fe-S oxidoreductase
MSLASLPRVEDHGVDIAALRTALAKGIAGEVRFERLDRALYSTDASVYQIVPLGVVLPKTPDDVVAAVKICARFGAPITARGGGTSQAGQSIGPGVILDFSKHYQRVLEINAAKKWVRVEPGCVLDDLNQQVKAYGLHFAPDISTANRATIGGMIANNSSGTHSIIHGKTIDHVLELKVLLADGSVIDARPLDDAEWDAKCRQSDREGAGYRAIGRLAAEHANEIERRYPKILRRVGGYNLDSFVPKPDTKFNLASMFVGSEGTLGIVLEAKLRLIGLPRAKAICVVEFADLLDALAAAPIILTHRPAAVEVMDRRILDCTKLNAEASRLRDFLQGDPGAILIIEFYGDRADELGSRLDALESAVGALNGAGHHHRSTDAAAQARIWKLRTLALGLSMAEKGDAKAISFVEDTAVAPERLRDYIAEFLRVIARHGTTAGVYAHASVGCLHVRPVIDLKTVEGVERFQAIADEVSELVLKYGGALSGEHGDGLVRSPYQEKMYGPTLYQAFREIQRAFDPHNLFNPGKIVDAAPLAANLRYGPAYRTPEVPTTFDFSADGGLTRAVELCAGVGECRKKRGGTMCPSYQATCDERHSTRGRANTLRLALTGQLGLSGLTDPAVLEALDLCLECKACKSECPTNVDMARLKAEVLDQYHKKHGLPWRNWIFGNLDRLAFSPRLTNCIARSRLGRWLNEKLFGIDRRRIPPALHVGSEFTWELAARMEYWLPPSVKDTGNQWFEQWQEARGFPDDARPRVLLFPDTFTNWYEPALGLAAADCLQSLGLRVATVLPEGFRKSLTLPAEQPMGMRCCGRPMISNGMLDRAVSHARYNIESLFPWTERGKPIIACEPSCILTIRDDYPALLQGELRQKATVVAERCFTFEDFVERRLSEIGAATKFQPGPKCILVQGHCHQRSLVGMGPTLKLLRRITGAEVIDLDAGCCGMAGSFGYEKEHYEVSRLVGEQRLFPALRQADAETVIVAPGFSCRLQIEHFTGRKALHPATLLRKLMAKPATGGQR